MGSLEPLLVTGRRWRRKHDHRRRSALPSLSADHDANASDDGDEDGNPDDVDADADADVDADVDDGVWPGEYVVPAIVLTEPEAERETVVAKIIPEVERAIDAAFAIGTAA